jgi:hypothetical protein
MTLNSQQVSLVRKWLQAEAELQRALVTHHLAGERTLVALDNCVVSIEKGPGGMLHFARSPAQVITGPFDGDDHSP